MVFCLPDTDYFPEVFMKKTNIIFSVAVGLGLFFLFSSCDLSIPESVSVKTEATYNFSIGDIEQDFNSSFDKSSLFSGLETGARLSIKP